MPVLPAVPSTTVPPGFNVPRCSASVMIASPARSFTEPPGFMNSALPRIVQPVASDARRSLISGVLPIAAARSAAHVCDKPWWDVLMADRPPRFLPPALWCSLPRQHRS
jgi:hypothetical protein